MLKARERSQCVEALDGETPAMLFWSRQTGDSSKMAGCRGGGMTPPSRCPGQGSAAAAACTVYPYASHSTQHKQLQKPDASHVTEPQQVTPCNCNHGPEGAGHQTRGNACSKATLTKEDR